jgi:hypothetical protein
MDTLFPFPPQSNRLTVLEAEIRQAHTDSINALTRSAARARDAGIGLIEAKSLVPSRGWLRWLLTTGVPPRTAQEYMQLARLDDNKYATVAHLGLRGALEAIAEPQSPREHLETAAESSDEATSLVARTMRRLQQTGEKVTDLADLKEAMRQTWREEHPEPEVETAAPGEPAPTPPIDDHCGIDTFNAVCTVVRNAELYPAADAAPRIDKWTRLSIVEDLPGAIAYLVELQRLLTEREAAA